MCLFFVKQKTAYEMRISDWSSDVCSSDLPQPAHTPGYSGAGPPTAGKALLRAFIIAVDKADHIAFGNGDMPKPGGAAFGDGNMPKADQTGRASCRERVCTYV